jgi:hypothetical protein
MHARLLRWLPAAALALVLLTFLPTLRVQFVNWDDGLHVTQNPAVVGGGASLADRLLTPRLGYPIPVTVASYTVEHALFGLLPGPYHATSVLLHLLSCLAVFALGRRLGLGLPGATTALLLFGLHPAVAEPVSWVSGRKDLLATVLALSATAAFLEGLSASPGRRARQWAAAATALFVLAALAKPVVLGLPLFWALLHTRVRGEGWRPAGRAALPAALVAVAVAAIGLVGQQKVGAVTAPAGLGTWLRQGWYALGFHLGLVFLVQLPLAKHIPLTMPPAFQPRVDLLPIVALAAGLALLVARVLTPERRRIAVLGLAWAALAYLPSSNLIPLNRFLADSYLYLPLAGLAWAGGSVVEEAAEKLTPAIRAVFVLVGLAVIATLVVVTLNASSHWRDGVTLWRSVAAVYDDSPQVCRDLGNAYNEAGETPRALAVYQGCARRFGPELFEKNIAVTLFLLGRRQEAAVLLRRLGAQHPDDVVVRKYLQLVGGRTE